ncbi:MAG TPA: hypothetical protein VGC20_09900, partial [bacterium]
MISGRLMLKFYLWLLLALTLSVISAGAMFFLLSERSLEDRIEGRMLSEVRLGRDLAEGLLRAGLSLEEVGRLLGPTLAAHRLSLSVLGKNGQPVLTLPA